MNATEQGIVVAGLRVHYPRHGGVFHRVVGQVLAVDDVSFTIPTGATLALVGESGSGKTTTGRSLLGLTPISEGKVCLFGTDLHELRRRKPALPLLAQMVYQDPYASLNPRMTVGAMLGEVLRVHRLAAPRAVPERVGTLLDDVGLQPELARSYPSALSGGQRQRVVIARALAMAPRFVVLDEVVSALDVSIQGQILNLLLDLQRAKGLTYLFISHNLGVVRCMAHTVAVMYAGRIVEMAPASLLFAEPRHPYTATLLAAVLEPDPATARLRVREEGPSQPAEPADPAGCRYRSTCAFATDLCAMQDPQLRDVSGGHQVACHHVDRLDLRLEISRLAERPLPAPSNALSPPVGGSIATPNNMSSS
jgi:oligopeptide/dipeptide ABC transporter ATP-binding protein